MKNNLIQLFGKNKKEEMNVEEDERLVVIHEDDCLPNIKFINETINLSEAEKVARLTNHMITLTDNYIRLLKLDENMQYEVATKMATHFENVIAIQVLAERDNYMKQSITESIDD